MEVGQPSCGARRMALAKEKSSSGARLSRFTSERTSHGVAGRIQKFSSTVAGSIRPRRRRSMSCGRTRRSSWPEFPRPPMWIVQSPRRGGPSLRGRGLSCPSRNGSRSCAASARSSRSARTRSPQSSVTKWDVPSHCPVDSRPASPSWGSTRSSWLRLSVRGDPEVRNGQCPDHAASGRCGGGGGAVECATGRHDDQAGALPCLQGAPWS